MEVEKKLCNKEIWSIITGRSSLLRPAEIAIVLNQNAERFCRCLDVFKKHSEESSTKFKTDTSSKWADFIVNISSILNLDARQSYDLFQSYLRTEYRGSQKHLQELAEGESNREAFLLEITKFYFEERLFLLKCIKYILSYWQDPLCHFQIVFAAHVDKMVNSGFIDHVTEQFNNLVLCGMVHSGIQGRMVFEKIHSTQGIMEQRQILEVFLLYYNNFELSGEKLASFAVLFQKINFGLKQPDVRYLHASHTVLIRSICCFCCLVLLEGIDIAGVVSVSENGSMVGDHHIVSNKEILQQLDGIFLEWDSYEERSPVVLAWSIIRYYTQNDDKLVFEELGRKAAAFDLCGYLISMLDFLAKQDNSVLSNVIKHIILTLVDHTFRIFHEESFGSIQTVYLLLQLVLSSSEPQIAVTKDGTKSGISILIESAQKRFPFDLRSYMDILSSAVKDVVSAHEVYEAFSCLKSTTELFDNNKLAEMKATDDHRVWMRLSEKLIIEYGKDRLIVPAGSFGKVFESSGLNLIRWNLNYSGWDFVTMFLRKLLSEPFVENAKEVFSTIASIIKLVKAVICHDWAKAEDLEPLISSAFTIIKRFHGFSDALHLIGSSLEMLATVADRIPEQIITQLNEICFLPVWQDAKIAFCPSVSIKSVQSSIYGNIMDQIEAQRGIYPVTVAYLQLVNVLCSKITLLKKMEFHCYMANIKFVVEHIFGCFLQWRVESPLEKKRIAKPVLEICHSLLGPFIENEATEEENNFKSLAADVLLDCFMNGKSGDTLLEILSVGVDSINYSLSDFSCNEIDQEKELLIEIVKLAFAVMNRLLSRKQISNISALEHGICAKIVVGGSKMCQFVGPGTSFVFCWVIIP